MPSFLESSSNGVDRNAAEQTTIERDQSQWLFTSSELLRSPSIVEGLPVAQELANRQKGVNFITQVGILLKLPQLTLATASVYLHRFFMRHAMQQPNKPGLHHYSVAATALFLATKVEENCRKMKELVVACCRVAQKQPNLVVDEQNKEYWKWRDTILHNEDLLLEALCFDLQLEQPYRILFDVLQYYGIQDNKVLRNTSWAFLNDSHITTMCLMHSPRMIAGAALYVGLRLAGVSLPDDDHGRPWWEHLDLDILEMQNACNLMFDMYQNPGLPRVGAKEAYQKEADMATFEKTRSILSPRPDRSPTRSVSSVSQGIKRDRADVNGEQSEEWGGPSASREQNAEDPLPSPKRPRLESTDSGAAKEQAGSRVPPTMNGSRLPELRKDKQDDVQQRIDEIVNASTPGIDQHSRQPSLTRRPSSQQLFPERPPTRQSDSSSTWQRPPSANSNVDTRPSVNRRSSKEDRPQSRQEQHNGQPRDADEADQVDYGSEEGEV